jgi:hypothetical protein
MYVGYTFVCNSTSLNDCVKNKKYACSGEQVNVAQEIETGAVVFLHVLESNKLIGPFTLSQFQTQEMLDALKEAPRWQEVPQG